MVIGAVCTRISQGFLALDDTKYDSDNCDYKQYVDNAAGAVADKSDEPRDYQNDCD